jgi:excisionase family DNA binding protein
MSVSSTGLSHHELQGAKPLTVTVATACKLSGLGNTTIWALIKSGKLESVRVCRRRLIIYRSLESLLLSPARTDVTPQLRHRGRKRNHLPVPREVNVIA